MGPGSDLDDLAKILSRFRGLETLAVRTGKLTGCKKLAAAILLHKDTLKFLMINDSHETIDRGWGQFSFIDVARRCKKLSQLGLSLDGREPVTLRHEVRVSHHIGFEMKPISFSRWAFSNTSAEVSGHLTVFGHFERLPRSLQK